MDKKLDILPSRWPHRIAMLLAAIVFPLIWVGGLVTTTDAGMAVPDWPNTYNYNMFAYPVRDWFFGPFDLFVEHGHRLLGSLAGLVAIALVVVTWKQEKRKWVFHFSLALLALVIFQGVLGGVRVLQNERSIAKLHGCVGPAFFAAVVGFCVCTSRWWHRVRVGQQEKPNSRGLSRMALCLLALSYSQLVAGAFLRHITAETHPDTFLLLIAIHLTVACALVIGTIAQFVLVHRKAPKSAGIRGSIRLLFLLILVQFGLGIATWVVKYGWPVWFEGQAFAATYTIAEKSFWQMNLVTAHVAVGSLILATWTVHCVKCLRALSLNRSKHTEERIQQPVTATSAG